MVAEQDLKLFNGRRNRTQTQCLAAVLGIHVALLAWSATQHSPVGDEPAHMVAGLSHWKLGRFDLYAVNPPLVRSVAVVPLLPRDLAINWARYDASPRRRAEFLLGVDFAEEHTASLMTYFALARWACIPFSVIGALVCYAWARDLAGPAAGWMALLLWSFSPSVLGHASLMTPDATAAALGAAACYAFWRWLRNPSAWLALVMGAVLGLAELSKGTWICLFGVWPALWLAVRLGQPAAWRREAMQLGGALVLSVWLLNVGYLFEGTFTPLGEFSFASEALSGREPGAPLEENDNRFRGSWLAHIPVPLPRNYVLGIDYVKFEYERGYRSYLAGESRHGGWWYYYLYAMAVKTPIGTALLCLIAVYCATHAQWRMVSLRDQLVLLTPALVVIALVSLQTGFNHHLRYVMPAFPFLFIFAGQATTLFRSSSVFVRAVPVVCLSWAVIASLAVYPHNLSYFNEVSGGPRNGWRHLDNSNVDWGQDLLFVKRWQDEHPEAQSLFVSYNGFVNPKHLGVAYQPVSSSSRTNAAGLSETVFEPGWYLLSLHRLVEPAANLEAFQPLPFVGEIGYSMRVYHLEEPLVVPSARPDETSSRR